MLDWAIVPTGSKSKLATRHQPRKSFAQILKHTDLCELPLCSEERPVTDSEELTRPILTRHGQRWLRLTVSLVRLVPAAVAVSAMIALPSVIAHVQPAP